MTPLSVLCACAVLLAASSVVHAVPCPPTACDLVLARDPNSFDSFIDANPTVDFCTCTCDSDGNTLLHLTVDNECGICAETLVNDEGCVIDDIRDVNGNTALHDAAEQCSNTMTSVLLGLGAGRETRNDDDKTPLCAVGCVDPSSECGTVARNIINTPVPPPGGACPCRTCDGEIPYDVAVGKGLQGVADVIGQDGGSPATCAAVPCP